jgi:hypothetical protein
MQGNQKMIMNTDTDTPIQLTSGSNTSLMPIQRLPPTKKHGHQCTLGVHLAPDGNDKHKFQHRLQQATKIKTKIAVAPLGREHIRIGFQAIWQMVIQLSPWRHMLFGKLLEKQCDRIQSKYLPTFLSRMGINHSMATAV